ncbi:hypothetical protein BKA62DRAFT_310807 [Auriculariales sp. MPI-PUGE-AT-0066]|nr:hypothetical protein BKA62DRAFT_310807 [Auriculariales sp. MPI-PUGE-AT-0066]
MSTSSTPTATPVYLDPAVVPAGLNVTALYTGLPKMANNIERDMLGVVAGSVLYGLYILVFLLAGYTIVRKRRTRLANQLIGLSTLAMFIISTFLWAQSIWTLWFRMNTSFRNEGPVNLSDRVRLANTETVHIRFVADFMFTISFLLGDAVIGWRILTIWQWHLIATIVLGTLYLATLATGFGFIGCITHAKFPSSANVPPLCTRFFNYQWVMSIAFNIATTILIAILAWQQRRSNRLVEKRRTNVDRVLMFLVVTGIIYIIISAPRLSSFHNTSLQPFPSAFTNVEQTIEMCLYQIVNLYPTAVTATLSYFTRIDDTKKTMETAATAGMRTGTSLFNASRRTPISGTAVVMMGSGKRAMEDRSVDDVSLGPLGVGKPSYNRDSYSRPGDSQHPTSPRYDMDEDDYEHQHHSRQPSYGIGHAV